MIWLAWIGFLIGIVVIASFIGYLLVEYTGPLIFGILGAAFLLFFFSSSDYLIKYYDKKEHQKLECAK